MPYIKWEKRKKQLKLLRNIHAYERRYESYPETVPALRHDPDTEDMFYGAVREDARFTELSALLNG